METKILTHPAASQLNKMIKENLDEGWEVSGSHTVVVTRVQNTFAGKQHMASMLKPELDFLIYF